ncbi:protein FAR1-RELATED SEQUENCE 9-like [Asparagus officinalis]|uniref:protein FAR1-RELATED SEQUENCE 9-like n=1 Tax=Asparagus officinalis TaxID=4686 RepID=UPI00098E5FB5|nr:protein FAR1-RELATED SEQUENCE 9-like [Asparagus officinalis]
MAGLLRTTLISESENSFFDKFNRRSDTLIEFYLRYESAIDKQRHTNARLNYEGTKSMPRMDTPLLLESDATELYTRTMFYKVKHAVLNNDVQCTCKMFEKMGIVCRHVFFALNQADVTKIPRHLVVNRWTKGAEMRHLLQFKEISEQCNAIEVTNRKLNDIWYDFQFCVSLAGLDGERLDYLEEKLKELEHSLRESSGKFDTQNKNDVMEFFVGSKILAEVIVKPPIEGRNKECGRRIVDDYEKSISQRKKKMPRLCNMYKKLDFHDTRTCPLKKTLHQSDV